MVENRLGMVEKGLGVVVDEFVDVVVVRSSTTV